MGFIKVSKNELRYSTIENLIGMPLMQSSEELLKVDVFKQEGLTNILRQKITSKEVLIPTIIEKSEQFALNREGQITESQLIGKIFLKNPGSGDKIWDIKLNICEPSKSKIGKGYVIQELNPQEQWSQEFAFENPTIPPLKIIENVSSLKYDLERKTRVSPILLKNVQNYLFFTLILENTNPNDIHKLEIFKRLPETVQKVVECKAESGNVEFDRSHITWRIDLLPQGKKVILTCKTAVETKPTTSGTIQIRYAINEKFDDFFVESLSGLTRMGEFISIKEKDIKPGVWDCAVSFLNRSEFSIQINNYDVKLKSTDDTSFVNLRQPLQLNPGEKHDFPSWEIESITRPTFFKHLDYTVKYDRNFIRTGRIQVDEVNINVFEVEALKEFSQTSFPSFKESSVDCTIKLVNSSTVALNHFYIQDTFPKHFIPPAKEDIRVTIEGESLNWERLNAETQYQTLVTKRSELLDQVDKYIEEINGLQKKLGQVGKDQSKVDLKALSDQLSSANAALETTNKSINQINDQKEGLSKKIAEKEVMMAKLKKDLDGIQQELVKTKELQDITDTITKETELAGSLTQEAGSIKQDIQEKEQNLTTGKNLYDSLTKKLASFTSKQDECKKTEAQTSTEFEDVKQKLKADKTNVALAEKQKTLKTKLSELKKEQTQLKKDINNTNAEISKAQANQSQIEGSLATLKEQLQNLQKIEAEKRQKIKSLLESAKNAPKPDVLSTKIGELNTKTSDINKRVSATKIEIKEANEKISAFDSEFNKVKKEKDAREKQKNEFEQKIKFNSDSTAQSTKIQTDIAGLENKIEELKHAMAEIDSEITRVSGKSSESQQFEDNFEELCSRPEFLGVKAQILPDNNDFSTSHELHLTFINLEKILKPVGIGQTLEIRYPLKTVGLNPNLQSEYVFPTIITCNSIPVATPYKFNIGQENLPSIEIEHKRQRISLGRIVDHYAEAGKFDISLIVKNESNISLTDLEVYDTIPKGAEITNTEYPFTLEEHSRPELSKVVWKLEKLSGFQEIELSYLLSLPAGESYNLNDMELSLK